MKIIKSIKLVRITKIVKIIQNYQLCSCKLKKINLKKNKCCHGSKIAMSNIDMAWKHELGKKVKK
jgi:hypothetical protein